MNDVPTYVLDRVFDAPGELVWKAWTDPALLSRWYGPRAETIVHKLDLRQGGLWLVQMKWGEHSNFQRVEYLEVSPPNKLVWLQSVTDSDWEIASNPMMPDWPKVLLTTVTFAQKGEQTHVRLTWVPHEATAKERACFAAAIDGLNKGWGAGMDILAELLADMQAVGK